MMTVVVTAYNAERHIAETLDSIRRQTCKDFEIIVVDDGSTDSTAEIVGAYPEVRLVSQPNRGQPAARNAGILAARGAYIAFVDADDLWLPSKVEKQVAYLSRHPDAAWVYSDALVFDSEDRRVICRVGDRIALHKGLVLRPLLLCSFIPSPTPVVKREVFAEVGPFDESAHRRLGEDWDMWLRIAERYPLALIREPLALIRAHGGSMTRTTCVRQSYASKRAIVEEAVARNAEILGSVKPLALANIAVAAGLRLLRLRRASEARRMFASGIRQNPGGLRTYCYFGLACLPGAALGCLGRTRLWLRRHAAPARTRRFLPRNETLSTR